MVQGAAHGASGLRRDRVGFIRGEVVAALSGDRLCRTGQDGWPSQAHSGAASRLIVERLTENPQLTLHGLKAELAGRGVAVSHNAVWQFIPREGLCFKKTLFALEQARADIARQRQRWKAWQGGLDPRRLVFIGETWIKTNMTPLRGWGRRASACAPLRRMVTGAR